MTLLLRLFLNAIAVFVLAYVLNGVQVDTYITAIIVAVTLSILNVLVKPILVFLTLPITLITLGLFLLIINGLIILLADKFIDGFYVNSIWWAVLFSVLLSLLQSVLHLFIKKDKKNA